MPVRVMLVDDQQIVVSGLRAMLQVEHDVAIVGEARGVKEALKKATELKPDVILMDVHLASGSSLV